MEAASPDGRAVESGHGPRGGRPRVVIVGGGFGGIEAARALADAPVEVLMIDRRNYHLFQPLLYQVATAALNPSDIAAPIRRVFRRQRNVNVLLAEVTAVDLARRQVRIDQLPVAYDHLVLAAGSTHSYFGHDEWEQRAPGLKTIDDATEIRRRFLLAFEAAEMEADDESRKASLTFVVVGGGPTGVELAGAMTEIARNIIPPDFRHVDTRTARVILIEGLPRVLPGMPERCSADALEQLRSLGVEVMLETRVTDVHADGVHCGDTFVAAHNVFWAAGVKASPLGETMGVELDRAGRVKVAADLSVPGHPEVFVVGDQAAVEDPDNGGQVPGVAQGALQAGRFVGGLLRRELEARAAGTEPPARPRFRYHDKGSLATIGRNKAVAAIGSVRLRGLVAWLIWAGVHVLFLVNFRSKLAVATSWLWTYLFHDRGARLITGRSEVRVRKPPDLGGP